MLPIWLSEYPEPYIGSIVAYPEQGSELVNQAPITPDGYFEIKDVPEGTCNVLLYVLTVNPSEKYWALAEDVTVIAGQTTDIGDLDPRPPEF